MDVANFFRSLLQLPAAFDAARAQRVLEELASHRDLAAHEEFRPIVAAVAGNSPYLARLILKDAGFVSQLLADGPEIHLARLTAGVSEVAAVEDMQLAQRELRITKRRVALAIGLADVCGVF